MKAKYIIPLFAGGQGALIRRQGFGFAARKGKPLDQMAAPFVVHPAYQINGIANGARRAGSDMDLGMSLEK